jgi:hypothetical protein
VVEFQLSFGVCPLSTKQECRTRRARRLWRCAPGNAAEEAITHWNPTEVDRRRAVGMPHEAKGRILAAPDAIEKQMKA